MKIMNKGKRSFHVSPDSVLKGGELSPDKKTHYIHAGHTVEVTEKCGNFLRTYPDVLVLEEEKSKKGK